MAGGGERPSFGRPTTDRIKPAQVAGQVVAVRVHEFGETLTTYSPDPKEYADVTVYVITGPLAGTVSPTRWFNGYLIGALRSFKGLDKLCLGRMEKGTPQGATREGWILRDVTDDEKLVAAAEKVVLAASQS